MAFAREELRHLPRYIADRVRHSAGQAACAAARDGKRVVLVTDNRQLLGELLMIGACDDASRRVYTGRRERVEFGSGWVEFMPRQWWPTRVRGMEFDLLLEDEP